MLGVKSDTLGYNKGCIVQPLSVCITRYAD